VRKNSRRISTWSWIDFAEAARGLCERPLEDSARVGQPDDIGAAIAALFSDDMRWVNAQRIEASGGMFV
jgi:NAD(P)-dependent dehydrogenase (short-subunit alcohol dehydrogenase family)